MVELLKSGKGYVGSQKENYFDTNLEEYIACKNGMLSLADRQLLPFNPKYRRRQ